MKAKTNIQDLISRLAAEESLFLQTRFLAPVTTHGTVQIRIAGAICRMRIRPHDFSGWGIFAPISFISAKLEQSASLSQRANYLRLFPAASFVLTIKDDANTWFVQPARLGDARFNFDGLVPIHGVDDGDLFDTIIARFDGSRFWFDQIDPAADPSIAAYMRQSIASMRDPRLLNRPGLTPEQRIAYSMIHTQRLNQQLADAHAAGEYRLRQTIEHAGAQLNDFTERSGIFRVSYTIDGTHHTSVIRKNDLTVQSAGICLSGQDAKFDLASLVSILRAGHQQGEIRHGLHV